MNRKLCSEILRYALLNRNLKHDSLMGKELILTEDPKLISNNMVPLLGLTKFENEAKNNLVSFMLEGKDISSKLVIKGRDTHIYSCKNVGKPFGFNIDTKRGFYLLGNEKYFIGLPTMDFMKELDFIVNSYDCGSWFTSTFEESFRNKLFSEPSSSCKFDKAYSIGEIILPVFRQINEASNEYEVIRKGKF